MAARSARRREDAVTCEDLLRKLKKGQDELNSSIRGLRGAKTEESVAAEAREKRFKAVRTVLERPLNRVEDLPRKRARIVQLSPDHLTSETFHEPRPKSIKAHTRRLSSTPKETRHALPRPSPQPTTIDDSLEEAILTKERERGRKGHHQRATPSMKTGENIPTTLPSPRMSRIVVDTSRNLKTPGSSKKRKSTSAGLSPSLRKSGKRNKRGLSVSFVQVGNDDEEEGSSLKRRKGNMRPASNHSMTEKAIGAGLVESLNASRYGALDRSLSQTRKQHRFPRRYTGDDPRLGYDWIAGLLDASEAYLSEKDDEYFDDIKEFRQVNYSECFRPSEAFLPGSHTKETDLELEGSSGVSGVSVEDEDHMDGCCMTCVSSYRMNDRFFPVLLHPSSGPDTLGVCCPVCEGKHSREKSPSRYIRVSVPHSALQASSKVRPHRRRSFDPTDSMGLAKHCLAGWESAQPSTIPPQSTVDLKSAVGQMGNTSRRSGRELLNMSHSVEYDLRSRTVTRKT